MTTHKLTAARLIGAGLLAAVGSTHRSGSGNGRRLRASRRASGAVRSGGDRRGRSADGDPGHRFWYRKSVKGGHQFVAVDAETLQKSPAFDHEKVSAALSAATGRVLTALKLPFTTIVFADDGRSFTASVEGTPYRCSVGDSTCRKAESGPRVGAGFAVGRRAREDAPHVSPDGRWEALVNNFNVAIRPVNNRTLTHLSTDGSEGNYYDLSSIVWSPDSRRIAAYRVRPGYRREVHYVESSPEDQLQPRQSSLLYAKPGDVLDVEQPVLFDVDSKQQIVVTNALFPTAFALSDLVWRKDARAFTFEYNERGHQVYRVIEVDAATGKVRAVISEEPKTFFNYRLANGSLADPLRRRRRQGSDLDVGTRRLEPSVSHRRCDRRSEESDHERTVGRPRRAARGRGVAPDLVQRRWNVSRQGSVLRELLQDQFRRRDGNTDIWGIIIRPTNFDPSKKYPVIENIYAGPQGSFVPKSFFAYNQMQSQAELGFIVVQIDGMGTANRSKAFHDVAWKNLGDAGFPDRILWHKAVAAKYPWYDITRVGIYGGSAGGQNALGGLLFHPEFYKAGVAYAGCHDNRMDKIWWNEQWMGWPIGPQYAASSNVDNAYRLQGDLLLVVGELDTNVDPSSTMQVVNQLIKHNKNFDLLVVPGANHSAGRGTDPTAPYGDHKRFDFFVRHLLGVNPPPWSSAAATPSSEER
jgi:Prolyl oligopeptidase family/Dipeptidyl peptidase IV (DPP IV) N-terminal region